MSKSKRTESRQSRLMKQVSIPTEVHLRLMRVRDALDKLERYLNDASVAGCPRVRIIHGKGTGILKGAVQEYLSGHPLVVRYYPASPSEGNGGVTIAELK